MLGTLLIAALSSVPGQNPALALTNDRITIGSEFTPARDSNKLLPGDRFFLAFDIEGLQVDDYGKAAFTMGVNVTDSAGKSIYEQKPARQESFLVLGGSRLPARTFVDTGVDMPPGTYTCKVTVTDLASKSAKSLEKKFEVLPKALGVVAMYCSGDDKGEVPAPFMGIAGQSLWLHFLVVGFERAALTKQPDIEITFRALDANNKPTVNKPRVETVNDNVPEKLDRIPISLPLPMNRDGKFTIEISVKDKVAGRTASMTFQVTVLPSVK